MEEPVSSTVAARVSDTKLELERQFQLFAVIYALSSLLSAWHRMEVGLSYQAIVPSVTGLLAFVVLLRSLWTIPLVMLSATHVVHAFIQMPYLNSADTLWLFFGTAVCCSFVQGWITNRSHNICGVGLYRSVAPSLRIIFVVSLVALSVARLNTQFIDAQSSPIARWSAWLHDGTLPSDGIVYLAMSALLVMDVALAVALLVPSLRRFAVGFGSGYVALLAYLQAGDAPLLVPAMLLGYCLFTSSSLTERVYQSYRRCVPFAVVRSAGLAGATALAVMLAVVAWNQQRQGDSLGFSASQVMQSFALILSCLWLATLLVSLVDARPRLTWVALLPRSPLHYPLIALFVVVAVSPYLGFGTVGRFTEFSGLTTAGGVNNHMLIPQVYLVDYERDLVQILSSDDAYLQEIADAGMLLAWIELVNYLEPRPETSLTFARNNETYRVDRSGDITELSTKNPWIVRKLFAYPLAFPLPIESSFATASR